MSEARAQAAPPVLTEALQWGAFLLLVVWVNPRWAPLIGLGAILVHGIRGKARPLIAGLNVAAGVLSLVLAAKEGPKFASYAVPSLHELLGYVATYLAVLFSSFLFLVATFRVPRALVAMVWAACAGVACLYLGVSGPFEGFLVLLVLGLWHNGFYFTQVRSLAEFNILDFLICQRPFFLSFLTPTPPLLSQLLGDEISDGERAQLRWNALALLALTAACNEVSGFLFNSPSPSLLLKAIHEGGLAAHYREFATLQERWGAVLLMALVQLMVVIQSAGLPIAVCQWLGIRLRNPVGNVFASRTIFEFFERTNRYYAILMLDLFIYPLFRQLRWLKSRALREFLSFFLGIFLGGMVQHYFRLFFHDVGSGQSEPYFARLFSASAYWGLIALGVSLSICVERAGKGRAQKEKFRYLRGLGYFVLGAIAYVFVKDYEIGSFTFMDRFRFALSLFSV